MKCLFVLPLLFLAWYPLTGEPARPDFIDPTGTYILTGTVKKNRITGHSGELRARLLDRHTVAVCFYINKGYPGYESGSFTDTLAYEDNSISYRPSYDTSCSVLFSFQPMMVEMLQIYTDPHSGCGFGPGIMIPATFQKSSGDIPIIQDLSAHGI
jgi:hypothetical protein